MRLPVAGLFPAVSVRGKSLETILLYFLQISRTCGSAALARRTSVCIANLSLALEVELQRELNQSRIADLDRLTKCGALIAHVAIHAIKLRVVPDVEDIASELHA